MGDLKYKIGDKVRIKSLDWYEKNKDILCGDILCGEHYFVESMKKFCSEIFTISDIVVDGYLMLEDIDDYMWTDEMIECKVDEEMSLDKAGQITDFEYEGLAYTLPDGYQFVDDNGNVINTTKIVLEKKNKEYPKTYEECCKVLGVSEFEYNHTGTKMWYRHKLMATLDNLMLCRDAYWKIAGEEMGLGKSWEPDYTKDRYIICRLEDKILRGHRISGLIEHFILEFPTEEMRDAFFNAFRDDIEKCKELI